MKHYLAVLLAAITAGLVSCQVASHEGVAGIPGHLRTFMAGLASKAPIAAKIDASLADTSELKAKVKDASDKATEAVATVTAEVKDKVAEVAEKAVEAVTPAEEPAAAPEAAVTAAPEAETVSPPPATAIGVTHFYGSNEGTAVAAWSAEAAMNPDYAVDATTAAPETVAEAPAASAEETVAAAEEPAAPAPTSASATGVTSYFGFAEKPDAEQLWAAAATVFAEPTIEPEAPAVTESASEPAAPEAVAEAAPAPAGEEPAPVSLGGVAVTSYFGEGQTPDAGQPWAAEATVYEVAAEPAPAAPAAEPAAAEAAATEEPAPVSLGGVGVTSYFGEGQTPDAGQPWSAPAKVYAQPAAPVSPVADGCRDALNTELKAGTLNFKTSSWEILPDSYRTLDKIGKLAKDCGGVVIEVGGHTDNTGRPESNMTLSELRAQSVVKYLTGAGVEASKLKAVGYGQDKPVATNDTAAGKRQNRRIEFQVTTQ
ncbi:MAG: OmpA family protein [Hyphomicrobium sp.]